MLQHIIGSVVGAAVAWLVLVITNATTSPQYVTAVVIGAISTILWPIVIGFFLARRVKNRRDDQIQKEVDRQINAQKGG
jgi:anaerobic C4-dicarboxylate transporter